MANSDRTEAQRRDERAAARARLRGEHGAEERESSADMDIESDDGLDDVHSDDDEESEHRNHSTRSLRVSVGARQEDSCRSSNHRRGPGASAPAADDAGGEGGTHQSGERERTR